MGAFTGIGKITWLALRRDRVKLPLTVLSLGLLFIALVGGVTSTYDTPEERAVYAATSTVSAAAKAFNGPVIGMSMESVALTETFTFFALFVALVTTLLVVRHTRQNEETGCAELIGSAVVGRYAMIGSALVVAVLANVAMGAFVALGYGMFGLQPEGSLLAGLGMAMIGIVFAGIAALAAQLTTTARAANGIAAASIGAAFLVRAVGDIQSTVQPGGNDSISGWLSWLSPMGIARNARPFVDNNWWLIGVLVAVALAMVGVTLWLASRRDLGAGLLPSRRGRTAAKPSLLSSIGLAWRLQRGLLLGWVVAIAVLAFVFGAVAKEVGGYVTDSSDAAQIMELLGGSDNLVKAYLSFSVMFMGVAIAAYGIQALLRARSEEITSHLELILATGVTRYNWLLGHFLVVAVGTVVLFAVNGLAAGLGYGVTINDVWGQATSLLVASLVYTPAALIFTSLTAALFGWWPRMSLALAWVVFIGSYLIVQFSALLKLPDWLQNVSPFSHVPRLPIDDFAVTPLLSMGAIALAVLVVGVLGFMRRDLATD